MLHLCSVGDLPNKLSFETLTDKLKLKVLEETRQHKRLAAKLNQDFDRAVEIRLLKKYEIETNAAGEKVATFTLNPEAFYNKALLEKQAKTSLAETEPR
jgi:hypothetical protein